MKKISSCLLLMFVFATFVQAQQIAQSVNPQKDAVGISLNANGVPLRDVLANIASQVHMDLSYGTADAVLNRPVTLHMRNAQLSEALERAVRGTGISASYSPDGRSILIARTRQSGTKANGVVSGKVTDTKTNRAISGATVSLDNDTRGVITDDDGSYRIANVSSGTHTVTIRLLGYAKQTRSVTVGESAVVSVDFKLEPTANVLEQVIVTGTVAATELKAVPNAMTIITAKQIEERGITKIEQLFRGDVPGLYAINVASGAVTANYGQVALFSRGATAIDNTQFSGSAGINTLGPLTNNMKMYVDGVQLADSSLKFLGQIDPKSIERMEILTGPQASTVYGAGAINGVIQIFTKRGSTSRPKFNLSFSSGMVESNYRKGLELNNYVTSLGLSGLEGRISYRMNTSWNYDGNWIAGQHTNQFSNDGGVNISLGSKITGDASARWSRRRSQMKGNPIGSTTLYGSLMANGVQIQGFGGLGTSGNLGPVNETASTGSQGGALTLNYRQFPWWSHRANIGFDGATYGNYKPSPQYSTMTDTSLSITDRPGSGNMSESYSSTMQLPLLSLASLNLTFGGDHSRQDMGNLGWYAEKTTGRLFALSATDGGGLRAYNTKPNRHSGAYVQGRFGVKDVLFFTYGVRADWDPAYGDATDVQPSKYGATFNQNIGPVTAKLRGSYGRSVRAPRRDLTKGFLLGANQTQLIQMFGRYYTTLPNPELVPEDQRGAEGGMDLYFGNRGSLSVTRYNQIVDNLIEKFGSDSVRTLLPVAPNTFNCTQRVPPFYDVYFDSEGYCYRYQQKNVNVGSIRNQGWELTGNMTLGPIRTRSTYSWTKSRILGINPKYKSQLIEWLGNRFQVGAPFAYLPEHTWALGMSYDYARGTVSLDLNGHGTNLVPIDNTILGITTSANNRLIYTRERMGAPSNMPSVAVPGYSNAYLNANHRFSNRINANLSISNLTNYYKNDYNVSFPTQGRTTRLGANVTW